MTTTISYTKYVNKIINLLFTDTIDISVFHETGHNIGKDIYALNGYNGLYIVMDLVQQYLKDNNYSNVYLNDLRELEWCFNGICDEFQA